jgi:hypothetical protein
MNRKKNPIARMHSRAFHLQEGVRIFAGCTVRPEKMALTGGYFLKNSILSTSKESRVCITADN